jgi:hypothetical protein
MQEVAQLTICFYEYVPVHTGTYWYVLLHLRLGCSSTYQYKQCHTRFDAIHTLQSFSLLSMNRYERIGVQLVPC